MYKLIANSDYILWTDSDEIVHTVPNDERNCDWQAYQAWLAADPENQPEPAE